MTFNEQMQKHKELIAKRVKENKSQKYWQRVCAIQHKQTQKGLNKYGYVLEDNNMNMLDRLTYYEEELVDALMYIEHIKQLVKEKGLEDLVSDYAKEEN